MNNSIKIIWNDTKIFSPEYKAIRLTKMETTGVLEIEYEKYYLIKDPVTINMETGNQHPSQKVSFYLIPKGMVDSVITL